MRRITFLIGLAIGFLGSAQAQTGDPLTDCVNATRAAYGLHALGYDPNLAAWAAANNNSQFARGIGHFVMGPAARQNAAWGPTDCQSVVAMWMGSGGHRSALLDATITTCGGAMLNGVWTWNGGYGQPQSTGLVIPSGQGSPPAPPKPTPQPVPVPPPAPCPTPVCYPSLPCSGGAVVIIRQRVTVRMGRRSGCLWRILHCGQMGGGW